MLIHDKLDKITSLFSEITPSIINDITNDPKN